MRPFLALLCALPLAATAAETPLTGSWTLVQADRLMPDGQQVHDYGEAPKGLLIIDAEGHYSLQIYDSLRAKYATGDRAKGTAEEYRANALGISDHFGTIDVDVPNHTMILHVENGSYPNQDGLSQKRVYELKGDVLSYKVAARPDGSVPISVWRRLK